jgi:hypothetical protein
VGKKRQHLPNSLAADYPFSGSWPPVIPPVRAAPDLSAEAHSAPSRAEIVEKPVAKL